MKLKVYFGDYEEPVIVRTVDFVKPALLKKYLNMFDDRKRIRFVLEIQE